MTIYNLTIIADPNLNGRSSPAVLTTNLIFPQGFKKGDVCKANQTSVVGGITWYAIYQCIRAGVPVVLPAPVVWASAGTGNVYIRLDSTVTDPLPPTDVFPTEIWVSMTATGERRRYVLVV